MGSCSRTDTDGGAGDLSRTVNFRNIMRRAIAYYATYVGLMGVVYSADSPKVLQRSECLVGPFSAIVEQVDYNNGLLTSTEDRVRIVGKEKNTPDGVVVFSEDVEPPSEKPSTEWFGSKLRVTFSRDANVLMRRSAADSIAVEFIRRDELVGKRPIGSLVVALQDPLRIWNRDDLTAKVWQTCRVHGIQAKPSNIDEWIKLIGVDSVLRTDSTLRSGIRVREVALTCIVEMLGEPFLTANMANREILGTGMSGFPERFYIKCIRDDEMPELRRKLEFMLNKKRQG